MQIAYHIGAQKTDEETMFPTLRQNRPHLQSHNVAAPRPRNYRDLIRNTLHSQHALVPDPQSRLRVLTEILGENRPERIALTYDRFICFPKRVFENGEFLSLVSQKAQAMRSLFPGDQISYFLALKNPATYVPDVFADQQDLDYVAFMKGANPLNLRWSDVITRLRSADPQAELTVWCDEDTPFIWGDVIRAMIGLPEDAKIEGEYNRLLAILTEEGAELAKSTLETAGNITPRQRIEIISNVISEFGNPDILNQSVSLPDWDQALINELTARYHSDVATIAQMEDVRLILPSTQ